MLTLLLVSDRLPAGAVERHGECLPPAEGHPHVSHCGHHAVHRVLWELSGGRGVRTHPPGPG